MRAREHKIRYQGGKQDDITVIVALIKEIKADVDNELTRDSSTSGSSTSDLINESLVNKCSTSIKNLEHSRLNGPYKINFLFI